MSGEHASKTRRELLVVCNDNRGLRLCRLCEDWRWSARNGRAGGGCSASRQVGMHRCTSVCAAGQPTGRHDVERLKALLAVQTVCECARLLYASP